MPPAIRADDKRLVTPPHILLRHNAMGLAAKLRPAGSVNLEALSRQRGTQARAVREAEMQVQDLLAEAREEGSLTTLGHWHGVIYRGEGSLPSGEAYLACLGVAGALSYIAIDAVCEDMIKVGPTAPRIMVQTARGDIALPASTEVVWR